MEACYGKIVLTQTLEYISVFPGQNMVIHCISSSDVSGSNTSFIHWYQKKPGQPPTLHINRAINHQSEVPDRFSGSRSRSPYRDFTLTINGALAEDEADYYC
ncbi:hypothetical protein AB205_0203750 [Aquarana catesbeiana]|uniref:Ig-like domain-containing protein n=1 Tax=Aquarana catesbeiana TaxID=8400 RepID=A0A2G9QIH6_AQUCT|nr:hypothetical protein AB205_0203750 [Aquarana catesbeiana]